MKQRKQRTLILAVTFLALVGAPAVAGAEAFVQCPNDLNQNGIPPTDLNGNVLDPADLQPTGLPLYPNVKCIHVTGGDGWITMGDGREMYIFSFSDVSAINQGEVLSKGVFRANSPAPTIRVRQYDELYLTLTNVGTHQRPDLFDAHTVHYHGFPNASAIFDGVPEASIAPNQQASFTYYYNNQDPGTYFWHCHFEATEHMQMGMLAVLYVEPIQNQNGCVGGGSCPIARLELPGSPPAGCSPWTTNCGVPLGYVYNDGDGSTAFDVEYVINLQALDHNFHDASRDVQPLPFAAMKDTYLTINGRGYPHTTITGPLHNCASGIPGGGPVPCPEGHPDGNFAQQESPQPVSALVTATAGQKVLLRLNNLSVVRNYSVTVLGLPPMKVVGRGARLLRGAGQTVGQNVFVDTSVVTLNAGETTDAIIDTTGVTPGTYFLYTTNLNYLSNDQEDFGGMMTEIRINP